MRGLDFAFYRLLITYAAGITAAYSFSLSFPIWIVALAAIMAFLAYFITSFDSLTRPLFGVLVGIFFFGLGASLFTYQTDQLSANHYETLGVKGKNALLTVELATRLASNTYNTRFYADVSQVDGKAASGKVLILFKRSDSLDFESGDRLTVFDDINNASNASNLGDFNYKEYLKSIDVHGQIYVDKASILNVADSQATLPWYVDARNTLLEDLENSGLEPQPQAMVEALVLGQRQNVDPLISQSFRDAGVIHILALSGLHVGILLLLLKFSLKWMLNIKNGIYYQTILIIILLWSFALVTGLSPSILRAVTMFTFVAIGMSANKKRSVFHSLAISAFIILLIDSRLLFNVGFQLSYTAVVAIVLLQPVFTSLLPRIKWWLPRNLWQIFTVTLAAQIGVAPLSIYYFHQFPLAFIAGNMILLGFLPIILGLSIAFVIWLQFPLSSLFFSDVLNVIFNLMIDIVSWISSFDDLIIKNLNLHPVEVLLWYIILISLTLFFRPQLLKSKRERLQIVRPNNFLHLSIVAASLLVGFMSYTAIAKQDAYYILHQSRGTAIAISNGNESKLFTHLPDMNAIRRKQSLDRLKGSTVFLNTTVTVDSMPPLLKYKEREILVIDESGAYLATEKQDPIVLLSHSPKINLDRLITDLSPRLIIADGSNYRNMVDRWEQTCHQREVKFINTYINGAIDITQY